MRFATRTKRAFLAIALCCVFAAPALAEDAFVTLAPRYRAADELQPILSRLFEGKVVIQSFNNKLLVSGDAAHIASVKKAMQQLDQKPALLLVELSQAEGLERREKQTAIGGQVVVKNTAGVRVNPQGPGDVAANGGGGATVGTNTPGLRSRVSVAARESDSLINGKMVGSVRVMSGGTASLASPTGSLTDRLQVRPVLQGESVTVDLRQQRQRETLLPEAGSTQASGLETNLTGRIGEWMEIGSVAREESGSSSSIGSKSSRQGQSHRRYYLRVLRAN